MRTLEFQHRTGYLLIAQQVNHEGRCMLVTSILSLSSSSYLPAAPPGAWSSGHYCSCLTKSWTKNKGSWEIARSPFFLNPMAW